LLLVHLGTPFLDAQVCHSAIRDIVDSFC